MINSEIARVKNEIESIDEFVKADIDALLLEHPDIVENKKESEFIEKHFDVLKRRKQNVLKESLARLNELKNSISIECENCEKANN